MRISEPKRKEVTRGQRTLHSERLYNSYSSLKIIRVIKSRRMNWAGHLICTKMRNVHKIFISKHERRPWCRWEDNIKMDLKEIMCEDVIWFHLAQNKGSCEHGFEISNSIRRRTSWQWLSFSKNNSVPWCELSFTEIASRSLLQVLFVLFLVFFSRIWLGTLTLMQLHTTVYPKVSGPSR